jgi:amino acid permease
MFYGHLKYFMAIRYILWSFGIFLPVLVFCTKKNLATLRKTRFFKCPQGLARAHLPL